MTTESASAQTANLKELLQGEILTVLGYDRTTVAGRKALIYLVNRLTRTLNGACVIVDESPSLDVARKAVREMTTLIAAIIADPVYEATKAAMPDGVKWHFKTDSTPRPHHYQKPREFADRLQEVLLEQLVKHGGYLRNAMRDAIQIIMDEPKDVSLEESFEHVRTLPVTDDRVYPAREAIEKAVASIGYRLVHDENKHIEEFPSDRLAQGTSVPKRHPVVTTNDLEIIAKAIASHIGTKDACNAIAGVILTRARAIRNVHDTLDRFSGWATDIKPPVPADGQHAPDCSTKCRDQALHKHDCDCGAAVAP